ncbi:MAG: membrane protein insertase YidC [Pseudomonadota bacterium]
METKRTLIAVVLSLIVLVGWGYFSEYMGWTQKPAPVVETVAPQQAATPAMAPTDPTILATPVFQNAEGREITVDTPFYKAVFHTGGGVLQQFLLKNYTVGIEKDSPLVDMVDPATKRLAPLGLLVNGQPSWSTGAWSFDGNDLNLAAGQTGVLRFQGIVDGLRVIRELHFDANTYLITEKLLVASADDATRTARIGFTLGATSLTGGESQYNQTRIAWFSEEGLDEETSTDTLASTGVQFNGTVDWAGIMSNYFLSAIVPTKEQMVVKGRLQDGVYRVAVEEESKVINPGITEMIGCDYWLGPKESELLNVAPNNLAVSLDYGWFSFIARPLIVALEFFHSYVGNYGVAIIILTIIIKLLFWPLSQKSYKSMEQMKKLQPLMAKVREKYADDREKMNAEIMALYKTYKVNPAGGCLPMLVQIPVFFGLYQALLHSIQLRHASFIEYLPFTDMVWLADLSAKDPYYITPLVMGASMFLQQRLAPPAGDPTQAKVMMFMPVIFTFMFLGFPSGLVIYWLCNNVLSIGQQWMTLRKVK